MSISKKRDREGKQKARLELLTKSPSVQPKEVLPYSTEGGVVSFRWADIDGKVYNIDADGCPVYEE